MRVIMHCARLVATIALIVMDVAAASAGTWYVAPSGVDSQSAGLSEDHPLKTIQYAINRAVSNEIIQVAAGTYSESLDLGSKNLTLIGDPTGTIVDPSTISPANTHRCLISAGDSTVKYFTFQGGHETNGGAISMSTGKLELDYCTLSGNAATGVGGAIYNPGGILTLDHCVVSKNSSGGGGGIYVSGGDLFLRSTVVEENSAAGGGGIYFEGTGACSLRNCTVKKNAVSGYGGGLYFNGGESRPNCYIDSCLFQSNNATFTTSGEGGGAYLTSANLVATNTRFDSNLAFGPGGGVSTQYCISTFTNCIIFGNSAASGGGLADSSLATNLLNCTLVGNSATKGGAIYCSGIAMPITNCIVWGNAGSACAGVYTESLDYPPVAQNSDIDCANKLDSSSTSISKDPKFVDQANGDLRLRYDSPGIDKGSNSGVDSPPYPKLTDIIVDFAGNSRIVDGDADKTATVDMGAYEYQRLAPIADAGQDQTVTASHTGSPNNDTASVTLDGSASVDPDGDVLTYVWLVNGAAMAYQAKETLDLHPGHYAVTLTVTDGTGLTSSATVAIIVNQAPNESPTANSQSVSTNQDTPVGVTLTGSDPEGDTLFFAVEANPSHGSLSGTSPNLTYTPVAGYSGDDSFTFKVFDYYGAVSNVATISLSVKFVDKTPPTITTPGDITVVAASASGNIVTFLVTATDNVDGPVPVTCSPASGSTFKPGSTTVTATATDLSNNTAQATFKVNVVYSWSGFLSPLSNGGKAVATAGSTVPVKFALTGASAAITNLTAKFSSSPASSTGAFKYDPIARQYVYNWNTKGLKKGTYLISANLGDGVSRTMTVVLQ